MEEVMAEGTTPEAMAEHIMRRLTPEDITPRLTLERTTSPYDLPSALGDLTTAISGLDTTQLSQALTTLAQTFADTPPDLKNALEGVAPFSDTLNARHVRALTEALAAGGAEAKRAFEAMMGMKKIDVAAIKAARHG